MKERLIRVFLLSVYTFIVFQELFQSGIRQWMIKHAIERWYDVTVFYENQEVKDYRFGFNVGRDESIDPILRIFEANGRIKIDRNGKVLRIRRGR